MTIVNLNTYCYENGIDISTFLRVCKQSNQNYTPTPEPGQTITPVPAPAGKQAPSPGPEQTPGGQG